MVKHFQDGGYEAGYQKCNCFWGNAPSKLVKHFLANYKLPSEASALDLGCGEGKNASALEKAGLNVTGLDCSKAALKNALAAHPHSTVRWIRSDAAAYLESCSPFNLIVMHGLLHCLNTREEVRSLIEQSLIKTKTAGYQIVVVFNDGPHDLSAHPGFKPLLLPHSDYLSFYRSEEIIIQETEIIQEAHPHNNLPHHHSITRLFIRKK